MAWLALAAMLAAALLPSIAHAVASDRIGNIMRAEICAPSGTDYAALQQPDDKHAGHLDDCPFCRLQADTPVLPASIAVVAPGELRAPHPPLFYHAPAPLFAWAAARPRGPPLPA